MINIYKSTPHSPSSSFGFRLNIWLCTYPTATSGCRFSGALSGLLSVIPLPRPQHLCLSASIRAKQELICLVIDSHSYHLAIILHTNDINGVAPNPPRFRVYTLHSYSYASPRWSASHLVVGESHQLTSADQQTHCTHDLIASVSNYQNHSYITEIHPIYWTDMDWYSPSKTNKKIEVNKNNR